MKTKRLLGMVVAAFLLNVGNVFAHTELTSSNPGNGAVLNTSPEKIELAFTEDVRLLRVVLKDMSGHEITTGFTPTAEAEKTFFVSLPTLPAKSYSVEWAVLGEDSHRVEGEVAFQIDPSAKIQTGDVHSEGHHHEADD